MIDHKAHAESLEDRLNDITNMVSALQLICWDVCQMQPDEAIGKQRRDALVGMANMLERLTTDDDPMHEAYRA
ncbi:hypothetical protein [Halovulum sp. GXIMD14793]